MQHGVTPSEHGAAFGKGGGSIDVIFRFVLPNFFSGFCIQTIEEKIVTTDQDICLFAISRLSPVWATNDLVARFKFPLLLARFCVQTIGESINAPKVHPAIEVHGRGFHWVVAGKLPRFFSGGKIDGVEFSF